MANVYWGALCVTFGRTLTATGGSASPKRIFAHSITCAMAEDDDAKSSASVGPQPLDKKGPARWTVDGAFPLGDYRDGCSLAIFACWCKEEAQPLAPGRAS